jgi:hypothetical protein
MADHHPQIQCTCCGLPDASQMELSSVYSLSSSCDELHDYPSLFAFATRVVEEGKAKTALVEQAIERLKRCCQRIEGATRPYLLYLSRAACLPDDVLIQIFHQLHEGTPWKASAVCRRWRAAALSCPSLWCNLSINQCWFPRGSDAPSVELQARRLTWQVERMGSRASRCTVYIDPPLYMIDSTSKTDAVIAELDRGVAVLLEQMVECQKLTLGSEINWHHLPSPPIVFKNLRQLCLSGPDPLSRSQALLENTPVLEELRFEGTSFRSSRVPQFQGTNLTRLSMYRCDTEASVVLLMLASTPHLVSFSLELHAPSNRLPSNEALLPLQLDRLTSIEYSFDDDRRLRFPESSREGRRLLAHLRAPNLKTLHIIAADLQALEVVRNFVLSSGASGISDLTVRDSKDVRRWDAFVDILAALPDLQSLTMGPDHLPWSRSIIPEISIDLVIQALQWPVLSTLSDTARSSLPSPTAIRRLCPQLVSLQLHKVFLTLATLRPMILSRIPPSNEQHDGPCSLQKIVYIDHKRSKYGTHHTLYDVPESEWERDPSGGPLAWLRELAERNIIEFSVKPVSTDFIKFN